MLDLFFNILNMSITASWLILVVIVLRLLLKKAPKFITWILWGMIAFRLIVPFSIESMYSLIPSVKTIPDNIMSTSEPVIYSGIEFVDNAINPILSNESIIVANTHVDIMEVVVNMACVVWMIGVISMFIYSFVSYIKLKRQVSASLNLKDNIYFCDDISIPFILGVMKPKIYVPSFIEKEYLASVLAHENAHLKRKDHIWKALGFLLLSLHWFNPFAWIAYILFGRDIEVACDELVIMEMQDETKKEYCEAIVSLSEQNRLLLVCPLAFGEINVKERINMIANYKKPAFWLVLISCALCLCACVGFGSNPVAKNTIKLVEIKEEKSFSDILDDVNFVEVGSDEHSYTCIYEEDRKEILDTLKQLDVIKNPISDDHSRDRIQTKFIKLSKTNGLNVKIYFDDEYEKVWLDLNTRTSLTYSIANKEVLKDIFDVFAIDYTDREASLNYTVIDGYVKEVRDASIVFVEVWHGKENTEYPYLIHLNTSENGTPLFRENEYIRVIEKKTQEHDINANNEVIIKNLDGIYYLNKTRITKDVGSSSYYSANQINQAIENYYNSWSKNNFYMYSLLHYYYDEAKAMDYLKNEYGDFYSIEDKMVVFAKALYSRRLEGLKYFSNELVDEGSRVEDSKNYPK